MVLVGWSVLTLVFVDELLAVAASAVWGAHGPAPWLLVWLAPAVTVAMWALFASPRAPYGGPVRRPAVKVLVFGLASAGLWAAAHPDWALGLLVFSLVVNALAALPSIASLPGPATGD